jgi:hypothetical protein
MDVPGPGAVYTQAGNDGMLFTPNTNIIVTALDYYLSPYPPENGGALVYPHDVAIYDASGSHTVPLVQTTIGPGAGDAIVGGPAGYSYFVSQSVTATELLAGHTYMLAGFSAPNENENGGNPANSGIPVSSIVTSGITLTSNGSEGPYYFDYNGSLDYPTIQIYQGVDYSQTAFLGPNFEFSAAVPEPTSLAGWSLLGLCVAGFCRWRKK